MSSPNISFQSIPASIRKPGVYAEFNLSAARMALPANEQRILIIGQKTSEGTKPELAAQQVFSVAEASEYFGPGSIAHIMCRALLKANPNVDLTVLPVEDAGAAVVAEGSIEVSGTATDTGSVVAKIGNQRIAIAVAKDEDATTIGDNLKAAIDDLEHELPVTAAAETGTVTLTAKNGGTLGNYIPLEIDTTGAAGISATITDMASGANDPDLSATDGALDKVFGGDYTLYCIPYVDTTALGDVKTHIEEISGPMEKRPALCVFGYTDIIGDQSSVQSLCGGGSTPTLNHWRFSCAYIPGTDNLPYEVGAAYAGVIASVEDPSQPLNNMVLADIEAPAVTDRLSRQNIEVLLNNGVTPLHVIPGEQVAIVRAITTYTTNAQGVTDPTRLDISRPRILDYFRNACVARISTKFPREKKTERVRKAIRSEILAVMYSMESIEILENVDYWKGYLLIEDDTQDVSRFNARIPADVVDGLHVLGMRIDLL